MNQQLDSQGHGTNWFLVYSGLLIAAAPGIGYIIAYVYELFYFKSFNVPIYFLSVPLVSVLRLALIFILLGLAEYVVIEIYRLSKNRLLQFLCYLGAVFVIGTPILAFVDLKNIIWMSVTLVFYVITIAILSKKYNSPESSPLIKMSENSVLTNSQRAASTMTLSVILLIGLTALMADFKAKNQSYFLIPQNNESVVVLGVYDDRVLSVEFDPLTKKILPNIYVSVLSSQEMNAYSLKKVGPLKPMILKQENP